MTQRTLTTQEISAEYGLTDAAIKRWVRADPPCPHDSLGRGRGNGFRFNRTEVRAWIEETGRRLTYGGDPTGSTPPALPPLEGAAPVAAPAVTNRDQLHEAKLRKDIALARKYELEYDIKRGTLVAKEEVERTRIERVSYARARLMGGPSSLAPDVIGLDIEGAEGLLRNWVQDVLKDLAGE